MSNSGFQTIDYVIVGVYMVLLVSLGLFLSRNKKGHEKTANDYFLAGNKLTWWAVGASLIAANISAEQFIGMSGSGYKIGICVAAYEIMAAVTLIIVAKFLLPVMLKQRIYTIPQFLRERYNGGVGMAFSVFWLFLYVFVNLTSVAWLGSIAIEQILGLEGYRMQIVLALFIIAGVYSIYGGLASVAWTDVLQVVFLIGGGLITAYFALEAVSGEGRGAWDGLVIIYEKLKSIPNDTHFNLIVDKSKSPDAFKDLPGIAAIVGGVWLTNIGYWGFNQYIIQKGLAAKNIGEAQKGLIFAGFLKILIPFIVVIPGVTAFIMFNYPQDIPGIQQGYFDMSGSINVSDDAYPWLIRNFAPIGIKGISFAALAAAVISSLASMLNSTSTIFTMDIYKQHIKKDASDRRLVRVGRTTALLALVIAIIAVEPLLGGLDQAFQYIQEYSGFIYPGIIVVFGLGLLWKRASSKAAVWTSILTIPMGLLFKIAMPEMPFQFRMGYVFIILFVIFVAITFVDNTKVETEKADEADRKKMLKWGRITLFFALFFILAAAIHKILLVSGSTNEWILYLENIGFEAFFFFGSLIFSVSLFLFSNANSQYKDKKAVPFELALFKTDRGFAIGSFGICLLVTLIYILLW
ncbi:sodium/sugar symporter [Proteiniphilum sp. UBA1028]|uniref:sodium/sugar symporter n=1 Tax=Proteiniphilum sp. UBA1028 TaxID=1947251 RepID=UPI000E826D62|nr:sodium/sugar symporter [Proteiniphilum sp. UBA1028]HBG58842.1 sodium/glucose cotransporter [Porphyromonadaceae bacterium]